MLAADVEEAAAARPEGVVRLLPAFDHYVVAAPRDADAVLAAGRARPGVPAAGLAVAGAAGRRADGRRVVARAARARRSPSRSSRSRPIKPWVRAGAEAEAERARRVRGRRAGARLGVRAEERQSWEASRTAQA